MDLWVAKEDDEEWTSKTHWTNLQWRFYIDENGYDLSLSNHVTESVAFNFTTQEEIIYENSFEFTLYKIIREKMDLR